MAMLAIVEMDDEGMYQALVNNLKKVKKNSKIFYSYAYALNHLWLVWGTDADVIANFTV